jgi:diacylglycerol kinase (ATP)
VAENTVQQVMLEPVCDLSRVAFVFNPVSGTDEPSTRRSTLEELAKRAGLTCALVETERDRGAGPLAEEAIADSVERLIVAGGDGSVTEAAHVLAGNSTALAVLPAGTGNLLATNLGIPLDREEAMRLALTGEARPTDVGRANGQVFLIAVGMGLDARMIRDADREQKRKYGALAYVLAVIRNLHQPNAWYAITIDGKRIRRRGQTVLIANLGRINAGLELVPDSDPSDGLLEVAILKSRQITDLARMGWHMVRGVRGPHDVFEVHRGRHVVVEAERPLPVQFDGETAGTTTRLEVQVDPGALKMVRPAEPTPPPLVTALAAATPARRVVAPAVVGVAALATAYVVARRRRR